MHELYELKEKLCKELKKYSEKELTKDTLEVVDKLSHAIKNIDKIIEKYEEEEQGNSYGSYNSYGSSYEGSYRGNSSRNGRGGNYSNGSSYGRGRNARRDSMGRYSSENGYSRGTDTVEQLREMMMEAPTEEIRRDYERIINRMESNM